MKLTFGGTSFHQFILRLLDLQDYIDSGIIECYLLGLASEEETVLLERMRYIYPELETEISMAEYRLQKVIEEDSVTPPAKVWNKLASRITDNPTYILQPRNYTMTVSIWWRCVFIAMGMIIIALLATTIYFFNRYHQLEERLMQLLPATEQTQRMSKSVWYTSCFSHLSW